MNSLVSWVAITGQVFLVVVAVARYLYSIELRLRAIKSQLDNVLAKLDR